MRTCCHVTDLVSIGQNCCCVHKGISAVVKCGWSLRSGSLRSKIGNVHFSMCFCQEGAARRTRADLTVPAAAACLIVVHTVPSATARVRRSEPSDAG